MIKRFQIPSTIEDQRLYQSAAKKQGLPAAEWARRILKREAEKNSGGKTLGDLMNELDALGETSDLEFPMREPAREIEDWTE